jgi:hypothetical protein
MWFRSIVGSFKSSAASKSSRSKRRRQSPRRAGERLRLESLEGRCLLTFMAPVDYSADAVKYPGAIAAGDFTGDGVDDLVVADGYGYQWGAPNNSSVNFFIGMPSGALQPLQNITTGNDPVSVAVGDFNADGKLDLATGNQGTGSYNSYGLGYVAAIPPSMTVLLGNGDGTFQSPLNFTLPDVPLPAPWIGTFDPQLPAAMAVGDMNHDGRPDLVLTTEGNVTHNGYTDVLLGNGDGTFAPPSIQSTGADQMALADFTGDGNLDVVAAEPGYGTITLMSGNGDGTLAAATMLSPGLSNIRSLTEGDVNSDAHADLVLTTSSGTAVLLGNGDGTFGSPVVSSLSGVAPANYTGLDSLPLAQYPQAAVVGDVNEDGTLDLTVATTSSYTQRVGPYYSYYGRYFTYYTATGSNVNVLLGNGDGSFSDVQLIPLNNGSYAYDHTVGGFPSAGFPSAIASGNFNSDGFLDLAIGYSRQETLSMLLNASDWSTATPASSFTLSGFPSLTNAGAPGSFTVTALNADGTVDTNYTGTVRFSSSDDQAALPAAYTFIAADAGSHTFSATLKTAGTQSVTATDATTGTVTASETGITVTPAVASHFAVSARPSSTAGSPFSVTVTALDPYNNTATDYADTVHFTSSDGQAGLPNDYTFTAGDAGVHTFTSAVALKTAGMQTVTATDKSGSSINGSSLVSVSPAAASTMTVSGFPSPVTAGVAGSFTVTLKDTYGNVASGYTGAVQFTSSDVKAVLPANYTFTSGDAGKHTFSATLKTAGTQSLKATAGALIATDAGITVKPAAASKFILSAPASVTAGVPFSLTIKVEDAYGNIVTGYVGTIHFTSTDSRAKLPANYTFTAGDNGVHTFTGLVLKKKGNDTITVADTKNSSVTGKSVVDVV